MSTERLSLGFVNAADQRMNRGFNYGVAKALGNDKEAAMLLQQMMYWTPKTKDEAEGWVYKKDDEWRDELLFTERELYRARRVLLERGLMQKALRKVSGAPTNHYRLTNKVMELYENLSNEGDRQNVEMDLPETSKSNTAERRNPIPQNVEIHEHENTNKEYKHESEIPASQGDDEKKLAKPRLSLVPTNADAKKKEREPDVIFDALKAALYGDGATTRGDAAAIAACKRDTLAPLSATPEEIAAFGKHWKSLRTPSGDAYPFHVGIYNKHFPDWVRAEREKSAPPTFKYSHDNPPPSYGAAEWNTQDLVAKRIAERKARQEREARRYAG